MMLSLAALLLAAKTVVVATTGNDANAGTSAAPFRTVQRALDVALAGDTIVVRAGLYRERVAFKSSGVTLQGDAGAIIDGGDLVQGWVPAPERGPYIYKKTMPWRPGNLSWKNKACIWIYEAYVADGSAWAWMNWAPSDPNWNGVEAMGLDVGNVAYVRFRNGQSPDGEPITIAPHYRSSVVFGGVHIDGHSGVVVRGLTIRNAVNAVILTNGAHDNVIENNTLLGGTHTAVLKDGATRNRIQGNKITLDYIYADAGHPRGRSQVDWNVFSALRAKTAINSGVYLWNAGDDNEVSGNEISQYYGGIFTFVGEMSRLKAFQNLIHNVAGYCIYIGQGTFRDCEFHDNLLYECDDTIRIDGFAGGPLYFYRNRMYDVTQQFAIAEKADDFGLGGPSTSYGPIYFYHNSLSGSGYAITLYGRTTSTLVVVNNVFSANKFVIQGTDAVSHFDYNWGGGQGGAKIGPNDVAAPGQRLWDPVSPTFLLAQDSTARQMGVDLSHSWTSRGVTHPALPGMTPGYFSGARPDAGAIQYTASGTLPTVTVHAIDPYASEADTLPGAFTISRTGSTASPLTVNFSLAGTATSGADYQAVGNTIVIPAGAASAQVKFTPLDDALDEGDETVILTLSSGGGYQVGTPASDTATIADNDGPTTVPRGGHHGRCGATGLEAGLVLVLAVLLRRR